MEKLRIQITSPQPVAKKVRKRVLESCDWPVGAVIAYRLICGNLAILRVIGYHTDKGGISRNRATSVGANTRVAVAIIDMIRRMTRSMCDLDQGSVQAFVNEEFRVH